MKPRRIGVYAGVLVAVASCEAIVGADFDAKTVHDPDTTSIGGGAGEGGEAVTGGGGAGGTPLLENGSPCTTATECASGECVDDVCCDVPCDEECQGCALAGQEGVCTPLPALSACPLTPDGVCDGAAYCATGAHRYSASVGDTGDDEARGCAFRADGQFWVGGNYSDTLDLGGSSPLVTQIVSRRVFLARFDATGALAYQTAIGDDLPPANEYSLSDLAVGPDGSIALVGTFDGEISACTPSLASPAGAAGVFVMKLDDSGNCVWGHTYEAAQICEPDSTPCPWALRVAIADGGDVAVAGGFFDWIDLGDGQQSGNAMLAHTFVAHHGGDGALVSTLVNTATDAWSVPAAVGFSGSRIVVGGTFAASGASNGTISFGGSGMTVNDQEDVFVAGIDGASVWEKAFGGGFRDHSETMAVGPAGEVVVAASFIGEINFGLAPVTNGNPQPGLQLDLALGKISATDGGAIWGAVGFSPFETFVTSPIHARAGIDAVSNVVVAGRLDGADVEFGGHVVPDEPNNNFLVKLNADAQVLWANAFGIVDPPEAEPWPWRVMRVTGGPRGEVGLCGFTANQIDLGGGTLAAAGARDAVYAVFEP